MFKIYRIILIIFFTILICNLIYKKIYNEKTVKQLDNITKIIITSNQGDKLTEIRNQKEIEYFLSTFKHKQKNQTKEVKEFKINCYILFIKETEVKFKIGVDYNYGYTYKIKNKEYVQQFTYATHRYLMDIR